MYFVTWLVGATSASLLLDGGAFLTAYLMLSIPTMVVAFVLGKSRPVARMWPLAGLLNALALWLGGILAPRLVEHVTRYITLYPGDVIFTGTPPGIGPMQPGDTVEVEIDGIGTLTNPVATATS